MEKELTEVYCGNGKGKTALAIGQSLRVATQGKSVIVIQFLKGRETHSFSAGCGQSGFQDFSL